ncbi:MAG: hypothetical protein A3G05_01585 [Candidatus Zambryskibacteria bacterium RIFCSPLOWO2_12_FULL_45_14]|uniref:Uncharacterized protein n=2 Tax=Candidatus Zambryskiibacteriota TaxID=1817925 RepID=A0A1G2UN51_9BACT|nr:MAG: hypothetical protein A3H60_00570 [Candidatus Zambryskibacteria bacterium RIFCSPLOWO2_02_FULL_44_12b]OHB13800.1 MAG: hypothetical protein A3G05_01585 [Candidatus Zambryskibacteria bacterium RIFCSPLOWO2_12_FULL_45_14]
MDIDLNAMLPLELIFNILITAVFVVYWVTVFVILYHLTRFGIGVQPKRFAAIFLLGAVILFFASIVTYVNMDTGPFFNLLK